MKGERKRERKREMDAASASAKQHNKDDAQQGCGCRSSRSRKSSSLYNGLSQQGLLLYYTATVGRERWRSRECDSHLI
jgi:hypothetical protein